MLDDMIELEEIRKAPGISKCSRCGRTEHTQHLVFKQNVSYFFARKERHFSGDLCFSCSHSRWPSTENHRLFSTTTFRVPLNWQPLLLRCSPVLPKNRNVM